VFALKEFNESLSAESDPNLLEDFFNTKDTLSSLFANPSHYESMKSLYGKTIAKWIRYMIKYDYALIEQNRIHESMLRLQIALLR
jgi:hypothetical protein